jgi:hypothetical protein
MPFFGTPHHMIGRQFLYSTHTLTPHSSKYQQDTPLALGVQDTILLLSFDPRDTGSSFPIRSLAIATPDFSLNCLVGVVRPVIFPLVVVIVTTLAISFIPFSTLKTLIWTNIDIAYAVHTVMVYRVWYDHTT